MRQEPAGEPAFVIVDHGALGHAVVTGFMVLQPEMRGMVAEGQQKVVITVMACLEERSGFGDQTLVMINGFLRHLQRSVAVGSFINIVLNRTVRRKRDSPEVCAGEDWRINQSGQRYLLEIDLSTIFIRG